MRLLREGLLSSAVMGVVLYLYVVAGGALLCSICGVVLHRDKPPTVHQSKIAPGKDSISFPT
jgi:hypothetical protein